MNGLKDWLNYKIVSILIELEWYIAIPWRMFWNRNRPKWLPMRKAESSEKDAKVSQEEE